jgi:hypothetical protein
VRGIRGEPVCIHLKSAIARLKSSEAWHLPIGLGANFGEGGRTQPDLADVQEALDYIMPGPSPTVAPATMPRPAIDRALPLSRSPRAGTLQAARQPEFSRHEPSVRTGEMEPALAG